MVRTLRLTLYKEYFDLILSGVKTVEYRASTDYWHSRLNKHYDYVKFVNGYGKDKPWMIIQIIKIIKKGRKYEIHLGLIVDKGNI